MGEVRAFSSEHVCRLTGLTERQLRHWDQSGFFSPAFGTERGRPSARVYSFRDVVALRTLAILRREYGIPLQELRREGAELAKRFTDPWSALTFYVYGRTIYFEYPETSGIISTRPMGQTILPIEFDMRRVAQSVQQQGQDLQHRVPYEYGRIVHSRHVLRNAPVLAGTRIPTRAIWEFHEVGYDSAAIQHEYPTLTEADIHSAIAYEERVRRVAQAG